MAERLALAGLDPWSMTLRQCVVASKRSGMLTGLRFWPRSVQKPSENRAIQRPTRTKPQTNPLNWIVFQPVRVL
jgi:hypothetical protein